PVCLVPLYMIDGPIQSYPVAHVEIQPAIPVVVEPGDVEARAGLVDACLLGDILERAVAPVVEQGILQRTGPPVARNIQIRPAIPIVVAPGRPEPRLHL